VAAACALATGACERSGTRQRWSAAGQWLPGRSRPALTTRTGSFPARAAKGGSGRKSMRSEDQPARPARPSARARARRAPRHSESIRSSPRCVPDQRRVVDGAHYATVVAPGPVSGTATRGLGSSFVGTAARVDRRGKATPGLNVRRCP
jgi:hypothetical protein